MAAPALIVNKELLDEIEEYASRGLTIAKIAEILGISEGTLYEYKRNYPKITQAWRKGKYKGCYAVANALFKKATEEGSVDAQKFYLSRRGGAEWREEIDLTIAPKPTVIERFRDNKDDPIQEVVLGTEDYTIGEDE